MTDETLLSLALQAIDDDGARQVLEDALLEIGPSIDVAVHTVKAPTSPRFYGGDGTGGWYEVQVSVDGDRYEWSFANEPDEGYVARALAAMLLFRGWDSAWHSPYPWPVAERCQVPSIVPPWLRHGSGTRDHLEELIRHAAGRRDVPEDAAILLSSPEWGTIRAHIRAAVSLDALAAISEEVRRDLPVYVAIELTAGQIETNA